MISVIIPAYNCESYLRRAIESVLAQQGVQTEIIVIDDGSTDGTAGIAQSYGETLRYIQQTNQGAAAARNRGLEVADGDFIAFLDADDTWFPDKLSIQLEALEKYPDHIGVFSNFTIVDSDLNVLFDNGIENDYAIFKTMKKTPDELFGPGDNGIHTGSYFGQLFLGNFVNTCSMFLRKSTIQNAGGFDSNLITQEDYDYWLRLSQIGPLIYLNRPLLTRCRRSGQLTAASQKLRIASDVFNVVNRYADHAETVLGRETVNHRIKSKYHSLALNLLSERQSSNARGILLQCLRQTSLDRKTLALLIWSLIPPAAADGIRKLLRTLSRSRKTGTRQAS
ncbi:hypothetical protein MNBD_GAMMA15-666 [hydrothermal vent metagenome]|uniref:Glycosyltransferase 2-like domain-containing protein n=1 Tax=hydrothermal vent metagenome TaxID=652676 RepID=A0A3B0YAG9_9ZZZZ